MAGKQPGAVEVSREKQAKHYQNPDGTFSSVFSSGAMHYQASAGGSWLDKKQQFAAGPGTNEWISNQSDVTMRTYQTGQGGNATWWIQFTETLSGQGIEFQVLGKPSTTAGSNTLSFLDGASRTWTYTHTRVGGKMWGPPMTNTEPATTYTFNYRLLGGAPALTTTPEGDLVCGSIFRMAHSYMQGANGTNYPAGAWTIGTGTVSFTMDHLAAGLPAGAYPFRLDPSSSFAVTANANDGWVWKAGTYPPTGAVTVDLTTIHLDAERTLSGGITNGLVRYDSSGLDDAATINSASVSGFTSAFTNTNSFDVGLEYYTWTGVAGDYAQDPTGTIAGSRPLSTLGPLNSAVSINLTNLSGISKTGNTSFRMHVTGGTPTGNNIFSLAALEHSTLAESQLNVDWTIPDTTPPAAPTGLTGTLITS